MSTNPAAFRIPRARAELPAKSKELLGLNAIPECAALYTPLDLELSPLLGCVSAFSHKVRKYKSSDCTVHVESGARETNEKY